MTTENMTEAKDKDVAGWEASVARIKAIEEATLTYVLNEEVRLAKESEDCAVLRAAYLERVKSDTRNSERWLEMNSPKAICEHRQLSIATEAMAALLISGREMSAFVHNEAFDIADRMMAEWERRKVEGESTERARQIAKLGEHAIDYAKQTNDCHFCNLDIDGLHDADCPVELFMKRFPETEKPA